MELALVIAYWSFRGIGFLLFGWAMMLCFTIISGGALGWRLQFVNASIRTYVWSAEALLVGLLALVLIVESLFVGPRRFQNMIAQPQDALLLLLFAHVIGLVPLRISMWLGWRVAAKLNGRHV